MVGSKNKQSITRPGSHNLPERIHFLESIISDFKNDVVSFLKSPQGAKT
jgi:hypothetical protein